MSALLQHVREQLVESRIALGHAAFHPGTEMPVPALDRLVQRRGRDRRLAVVLFELQRLDRLGFRVRVEDERPDNPLGWDDLPELAAETGLLAVRRTQHEPVAS